MYISTMMKLFDIIFWRVFSHPPKQLLTTSDRVVPQRNYIKQDVMFCHQEVHHHREKSKRLVHPVLFFFLFCSIWNILGGKKFQQQILNTDGCVWHLFFRWLWPPFESQKQKQVQHDLFWVHSQHSVGNYIYSPVCHSLGGVFLVICFCF